MGFCPGRNSTFNKILASQSDATICSKLTEDENLNKKSELSDKSIYEVSLDLNIKASFSHLKVLNST